MLAGDTSWLRSEPSGLSQRTRKIKLRAKLTYLKVWGISLTACTSIMSPKYALCEAEGSAGMS